jgi:hypothetical protein
LRDLNFEIEVLALDEARLGEAVDEAAASVSTDDEASSR